MIRTMWLGVWIGIVSVAGCASDWKVHGGPAECIQMCRDWDMELVGMVGVGNQSRMGGGATACVCEPPRHAGGEVASGASGMAAGTGAVAVMLAEQAVRAQQQGNQP